MLRCGQSSSCGRLGALRCGVALVVFAAMIVLAAGHARAGIITGFVNNPTGNSGDFASAVAALGGTVDSSANFNTHPAGALQSSFYLVTHGMTLLGTGGMTNVAFGAGPAQPNTGTAPVSIGEGTNPSSNHVQAPAVASTLTLSFNSPILGVGLFVVDLFNPGSQPTTRNPVSIDVFAGPNATGTLLGHFGSAQFNFQPNRRYFMGVTDTDAGIRSLRLNHPADASDQMVVDDIRIAVPEPSSLALVALAPLAALRRQRRRRTARPAD